MPSPVSSNNSSYYDPAAQLTPIGADFSTAPAATCSVEGPAEVTIAPVLISGDAGARELVKQHDAARSSPNCSLEAANAALSCGKAALVAATTVAVSTTVVGTGLAIAATFAESISCGKDLRAYYDCKTE